jgi:hypothetical protein
MAAGGPFGTLSSAQRRARFDLHTPPIADRLTMPATSPLLDERLGGDSRHDDPELNLEESQRGDACHDSRMEINVEIDATLLARAREVTSIENTGDLINHALRTMLEVEASRRLAALGGSMPDLEVPE